MIPKIGLINHTYHYINRYQEIIAVLAKHGFSDFVSKSNLEKYINLGNKLFLKKKKKEIESFSTFERIRMVLEELGPAFIKFGQIMSSRPDLLPLELIIELEKLQDSVPFFPTEEARKLIEKELGKPIFNLFSKFNNIPVAAASIAQVYQATLKSGEEVVIKVQRPEIEKIIKVDMEIMIHLAIFVEKHITGMDLLNIVGIIKEFEKSIKKEIDFTIEATHIERFGRNFKDDETIHTLKIYREYSTKKILTMEFINGVKISNIYNKSGVDINSEIIASRGADLILKQIFEHGFFHADPHPGNILVLKNNIICFIDFGMMGNLLPKHRENIGNVIIGIVNNDSKKTTKALLQFTKNNDFKNIDKLELQVYELMGQYSYLSLKNINMGNLLNDLRNLIMDNEIKILPNIYLLLKALVTIEGVGRKLDSDFDMISHIEPFAKKFLKKRLNPYNIIKDIFFSTSDFFLLLHDLPSGIREIVEQIKSGNIKIEFEHKGLKPMLKEHNQISNRISFSIVLSSLIIGSSLIVLSKVPPLFKGIPIIGIVGFLGAGLMGFWLLISILRHNRM